MPTKATKAEIESLATKYGLTYAQVMMIVGVESTGVGFSAKTGRIIIQFEASWFKRTYVQWKKFQGTWINNKVGDQTEEWNAFNNAFSIDPTAAMLSTSIGMLQVMGFHFKLLGFKTVGEMWDFAKKSEVNQIELGLRFIKSNPKLYEAVKRLHYPTIAYYYNGEMYHLYNYDQRLKKEYSKFV